MRKDLFENLLHVNRRQFLSRLSVGVGSIALGSLLIPDLFKGDDIEDKLLKGLPHFAPKAKRIIYLFQAGGPSQLELFDFKPELAKRFGEDLPESIRNGQ